MGEDAELHPEDVVAINLGGFDYALTALFPDGSSIHIPYGELTFALRALLLGLWQEDYVVLVENPIVVAVEIDESGKEIGPGIKERLFVAQLIRELIRESGIRYREVEGNPEKYTTCPGCGERVMPAERFITYTETEEDYREFLKRKDELLADYEDVIGFTRGEVPLPDLILFPMMVTLADREELKRLKKCVKSQRIAAKLAEQIGKVLPDIRAAVVCWLYSDQDVVNEEKMDELSFTVESLVFERFEELWEKYLPDNVVIVYGSSGKIYHIPQPEHPEFGRGAKLATGNGTLDLRLMFLPVVLDTSRTDIEFEELYETVTAAPGEVFDEIGRIIQKVYRLKFPPVVSPPVPAIGVEEFIDTVYDELGV